jgi:hypothetical protein
MALLIDTLSSNKNVFNPSEGLDSSQYGIWDLTKSSVSFQGVNPQLASFAIVPEYFQMRPDLIATLKMGDQGRMGSLLKFNGLSNPFAVYEGQILAVPTSNTVDEIFRSKKVKEQSASTSNTNTNPLNSFKKNQQQKKFQVSPGRKKFLDEKIKNKPVEVLPPNITQPGETTILKQNGFIVFAPNSGGGGFNTPTAI